MLDHRRGPESAKLFQFGYIRVLGRPGMASCIIRNIAEDGVDIEVAEPRMFPNDILVAVSEREQPRSCRVLWRQRDRMGVIFTD